MTAYYNENDPFAAAWLRELIKAGSIAPGDVDERSIADVRPDDLRGYPQCHFFAGIGGWSHALRLADWDDARPVWTGSCPCQPFSAVGKQAGVKDDRHLWPEFFRLIRECRPDTVFGEQVASAIGHGWLDTVSADLEGESYAVGAVVLGAHSVGAPHLRQRLWFVGESDRARPQPGRKAASLGHRNSVDPTGGVGELADLLQERRRLGPRIPDKKRGPTPGLKAAAALANWCSPASRDWKDTPGMATTATNPDGTTRNRVDQLSRQAQLADSGSPPTGYSAATEKPGQLNPAHSRWLMGYPPEWDDCAVMVMPLPRRSRRDSLKHIKR